MDDTTATPSPKEPGGDHNLTLAAIIREVHDSYDLGAAALAEAIMAHPAFSGCHDGPTASPAQGEVGEAPLVPPDFFDPEHQGEDRKLLEVFYGAAISKVGTTDEGVLRGIKAALALRPSVAEARAADAAIADEALDAEFRAWWKAKIHPLNVPAFHTVSTHIAWGRHLLTRGQP